MHYKQNPRVAACETLYRVAGDGAYPHLLPPDGLTIPDRALYTLLVNGVLERMLPLDWVIDALCAKKPNKKARIVLQVGLYQVLFTEIPPHAAVGETVKAADALLSPGEKSFVNAVLRTADRERDRLYKGLRSAPEPVRYSVSESVLRLLRGQYGDWERILSAFNEPKPLCLRVNTLRTSVGALMGEFPDLAAIDEKSVSVPSDGGRFASDSGGYFIQSLASRRAADALDARPGMTVVDVCACPGGKSFSLAMDMQNEGVLHALDLRENKLTAVQRGRSGWGSP